MTVVPILCVIGILGLGLVASSCTVTPTTAECERACAVASRCGLLPSALGGEVGERTDHNLRSCVDRCVASEADDPQVTGLLAQLGEHASLAENALCGPDGVRTCEDVIAALENDPDTSELEVTTELTVRMVNLVSYVTSSSLASWCCLDHRYDLEGVGDGVDELAEVYDIIEDTRACLEELRTSATSAAEASATIEMPPEMLDPEEPDPVPAAMMTLSTECMNILDLWREPMLNETMTSKCVYARASTRMGSLAIPSSAEECEALGAMGFGSLAGEITMLQMGLHLESGGFLVQADGTLREQEEIRAQIQDEIHSRLAHPGAPLEGACAEIIGTTDISGCDTLDREALAEPPACEGGPACSPVDCLDDAPACDTTLCDLRRSPPGRDCGELGVTEVRLGYSDASGLEVLGDPIGGCEALTEVVTTFEGVKVGTLTPVAVVSGTLPTFLSHDAAAGSFSWIVSGDPQWVAAGAAELEVPSPLLQWTEHALENPLEMFGWVTRRVPTGKPCDLEPAQCEGYFNDNCDNGIDDDSDGLTDDDSAWCDELMHALVDRCVVAEPGREPDMACRRDMPP